MFDTTTDEICYLLCIYTATVAHSYDNVCESYVFICSHMLHRIKSWNLLIIILLKVLNLYQKISCFQKHWEKLFKLQNA